MMTFNLRLYIVIRPQDCYKRKLKKLNKNDYLHQVAPFYALRSTFRGATFYDTEAGDLSVKMAEDEMITAMEMFWSRDGKALISL